MVEEGKGEGKGREGEAEGREREGPKLLLNQGPSEPCYATARLIAPVVTTISIILSSNKIQNGDVLVLANPDTSGKWPFKRRDISQGPVVVAQVTETQCTPTRTVYRRSWVQFQSQLVDFMFGLQGFML